MKINMAKLIIFFLFVICYPSNAQVEIRGSMGLNFVSLPNLRDYVNENYAPSFDRVKDFVSAVEFGLEGNIQFAKDIQGGLELTYQITSFTYNTGYSGRYDFSYSLFSPSTTVYYVIPGNGYKFKFGGGVGPRFLFASETKTINLATNYSAIGYGMVLKVEAATALGKDVFAYIAGDIRVDAVGTPSTSSGEKIVWNKTELSISAFSAGLKLGVLINL